MLNALRMLRRSPGYALTCIVVLVLVWERYPNMPDPPSSRISVTHYSYLGWQRENTVFSDMAAFCELDSNETGIERPDHGTVALREE